MPLWLYFFISLKAACNGTEEINAYRKLVAKRGGIEGEEECVRPKFPKLDGNNSFCRGDVLIDGSFSFSFHWRIFRRKTVRSSDNPYGKVREYEMTTRSYAPEHVWVLFNVVYYYVHIKIHAVVVTTFNWFSSYLVQILLSAIAWINS